MSPCHTGSCGHPCLCKGSLDHLNERDTKDLGELVNSRLLDIGSKAATEKNGELMIPYKAIEVRLKLLKIGGTLTKVDHLLHRTILRSVDQGISSVSGMRTVLFDENDTPTFVAGRDPRSNLKLTFDVVNYEGVVSASVNVIGSYIENAYIQLIPTVIYLPADME